MTAVLLCAPGVRAAPPMPPDLRDVAGNPLPPVEWTHAFNFDDGPQGWTIVSCAPPCAPDAARWVNPALEPGGPILPDGAASGTSGWQGNTLPFGGGSLYLPGFNAGGDQSVAQRTIASITSLPSSSSMVIQVDVYVPNLLPLGGFRHSGAYPGSHIEGAGFCLLRDDMDGLCLEGATPAGSQQDPEYTYNGYVRFRDFTGSAGNSWQFPTCCGNKRIMTLEGIWPTCHNTTAADKTAWWNNWVTLYVNYNYSRSNEVYVWAYIPWSHPHPNCTIAGSSTGWIELVRRPLGAGGVGPQEWSSISLGGRNSWTQGQWDNVKLAIQPSCNSPPLDDDGDRDVDLDDYGAFQRCYTGPNPEPGEFDSANCRCFDRHPPGAPDNAIDAADLAVFTACLGRAGVPATATGCGNGF